MIRLVPGLGTRAVDRLSDDYPVLIALGEPNLKVSVTADETIRYSPKSIDVINLENRSFETIKIEDILKEYGKDYPGISKLVSLISDKHIQEVNRFSLDFKNDSQSEENNILKFK